MKISIITLFPEIFELVLNSSILSRAQTKGLVEFELINLKDFAVPSNSENPDSYKQVDDRPYGGGAGMILKADVLAEALKKGKGERGKGKVILTSASGTPYTQKKARELSKEEHIIVICGHYEGVDQRFIDHYVDEEISIGDYVLTGGEIPAMILADSITRLVPGVLAKEDATINESFENGLLEYPHYTKPQTFEDEEVPEILKSGNHGEIAKWKQQKSLEKTRKIRPDLLNEKINSKDSIF